jgi:hypothetical protein
MESGPDAIQRDTFFVALSRFKRQKYDESIELCTELLEKNPRDQVF